MTRLLGSERIANLAREESVLGVLVRMALEQSAQADHEEKELLEDALELLLNRFNTAGGDDS